MSEEQNKNIGNEPGYDIDTITNQRLIKGHVYDGIYELDNDLPPWWKWLFYISILFLAVYLIRLFFTEAPDLRQIEEYNKELAAVQAKAPAAADFQLVLLTDEASLTAGKTIWEGQCGACHLASGAGIVGPNMTDDYWIHGNTLEELFAVVENGVLEKGMIPYRDQLSPQQRLQVISYMLSLHGTNPVNPKEAQGEMIEWPY
ncbi:MAG: c-type cytochrome [Bacteroidales bacterium]|nr:c-type cytochrome [Bacteroidales bacterium]